jgi:hypothetical protein
MSDLRLDRVIDEVARQMTEGAAPDDLRTRVLAQIATNAEGRTTNVRGSWFDVRRWVLAAVPVAALIVLAIFVARPFDRRAESPAPQVAAIPNVSQPPVSSAATPSRPNVAQPSPNVAQPSGSVAQPFRAAVTRPASEVEALAPPLLDAPSIAVGTLTTDSLALEELETPAPIAIAPLATPEGERP